MTSPLESRAPQEGLTQREWQVGYLLAEGIPLKNIAARLGVSIHTVRRHTEKIYRKLAVNTRTMAAVRILQAGRAEEGALWGNPGSGDATALFSTAQNIPFLHHGPSLDGCSPLRRQDQRGRSRLTRQTADWPQAASTFHRVGSTQAPKCPKRPQSA